MNHVYCEIATTTRLKSVFFFVKIIEKHVEHKIIVKHVEHKIIVKHVEHKAILVLHA